MIREFLAIRPRGGARAALFTMILASSPGLPPVVQAHDSPEHVIEHLTARMKRAGRTADLLYRRAGEYRVMGKLALARKDLEDAISLDPRHQPAHRELSQVQLAEGAIPAARVTIDKALKLATSPDDRAPLWIIRSDISLAANRIDAALADCQVACARSPDQVDWQLKQSQILALLGQHDARTLQLKTAYDLTQSAVLRIEWIEAMIDAGHSDSALEVIEPELADARLRSSWLLRRARALAQIADRAASMRDARAALDEIDTRINPQRPDASLLCDRALACALLSDRSGAKQDLAAAKRAGATQAMLSRAQQALAAARP